MRIYLRAAQVALRQSSYTKAFGLDEMSVAERCHIRSICSAFTSEAFCQQSAHFPQPIFASAPRAGKRSDPFRHPQPLPPKVRPTPLVARPNSLLREPWSSSAGPEGGQIPSTSPRIWIPWSNPTNPSKNMSVFRNRSTSHLEANHISVKTGSTPVTSR